MDSPEGECTRLPMRSASMSASPRASGRATAETEEENDVSRNRVMSDCSNMKNRPSEDSTHPLVERRVSFSEQVIACHNPSSKVQFIFSRSGSIQSDSDSPHSTQSSPGIKRKPTGRRHKPGRRSNSNTSIGSAGPVLQTSQENADTDFRPSVQRRGTARRPGPRAKSPAARGVNQSSSTDIVQTAKVSKSGMHLLGRKNSKEDGIMKSVSNPNMNGLHDRSAAQRTFTGNSLTEQRISGFAAFMRKLKL